MRSRLIASIVLASTWAMATSSRVFVPVAGGNVTVDTLRLDVLDVQGTTMHYATVRATDGAVTRTLVLTDTPTRVPVVKAHAIRLSDRPFGISVTPAPALAIDSVAAERIAVARAKSFAWASTTPRSVLLTFGTTWEITFHLAEDLDGVVQIDAATGHVISAAKVGGF